MYACMYPHNITDFLALHVALLSLLSSLFTRGRCIPRGAYSTSQVLCIIANLNVID